MRICIQGKCVKQFHCSTVIPVFIHLHALASFDTSRRMVLLRRQSADAMYLKFAKNTLKTLLIKQRLWVMNLHTTLIYLRKHAQSIFSFSSCLQHFFSYIGMCVCVCVYLFVKHFCKYNVHVWYSYSMGQVLSDTISVYHLVTLVGVWCFTSSSCLSRELLQKWYNIIKIIKTWQSISY